MFKKYGCCLADVIFELMQKPSQLLFNTQRGAKMNNFRLFSRCQCCLAGSYRSL